MTHPINEVYMDAANLLEKARLKHGGNVSDFYAQQWTDVTKRHGLGFLTGQAVKKINEAAVLKNTVSQAEWEKEMMGALNYVGMAILYRRLVEPAKAHPPMKLNVDEILNNKPK